MSNEWFETDEINELQAKIAELEKENKTLKEDVELNLSQEKFWKKRYFEEGHKIEKLQARLDEAVEIIKLAMENIACDNKCDSCSQGEKEHEDTYGCKLIDKAHQFLSEVTNEE